MIHPSVQLLTKGDLVKVLRVSMATVKNWEKSAPGFPEPVMVTKVTKRYRLADVEKFLDLHCKKLDNKLIYSIVSAVEHKRYDSAIKTLQQLDEKNDAKH